MSNHSMASKTARPDALDRALTWSSALPVALIVILTFIDVLGRYIFSAPLRGSLEIIEYAMALVIFGALPLVTRRREHVTVSLIENLVKGQGRRIKLVLCDAISAIALGMLTWRLSVQALEDLESGGSTIVLNLPHAPLNFILTAFAGLSTLIVLMMIGRTLTQTGESK